MILVFVGVSATVGSIVENFQVNERIETERESTLRLASDVSEALHTGDYETLHHTITERASALGGRILLYNTSGVVWMDSAARYNGYHLPYREVRDVLVDDMAFSYGFHDLIAINQDDNSPFMLASDTDWVVYYTAPVMYDSERIGAVLFSQSIQDAVDSVDNVTALISVVFLASAVLVGVVSLLVTSYLTKPIVTLTQAIERVGSKGYGQHVPVKGRDELAELSSAFNIMSEKLENHERLRDEFVSNASHELKTPLTAMKILAETMLYQEEPDPEMSREFFQDIDHEVDRLTHIITDLLRMVQQEQQSEELTFAPVDLEEIVQRVIRRLMPLAKKKGIRLEKKLVKVNLMGDESRLEQVAMNLIDNALKYTDKGSIAVTLKTDGNFAVLIVRDTGIGIPKEAIPRLFERFYRVDKARSRETGGTGLGLSIVERIVSMHGGFLNVESVVGRGTTFTARLPIAQNVKEEENNA